MPPIPESYVCTKCKKRKPRSGFYFCKNTKRKLQSQCSACHKEHYITELDKKLEDIRYRLLYSSLSNSQNRGLEHTITINDIKVPEFCPYTGIKLNLVRRPKGKRRARVHDTPSIDRIDNTKGYVPGNIQIISDLANRMKQNATIEELITFAENVLKIHKKD